MTAKEVIAIIEKAGWYKDRQSGSHAVYKHEKRPGRVVVPMHPGDIPKGTLRSIIEEGVG